MSRHLNRAEKRRADRRGQWADLAHQLRVMADSPVCHAADRIALQRAARLLDQGKRPMLVMRQLAPVMERMDKLTARQVQA